MRERALAHVAEHFLLGLELTARGLGQPVGEPEADVVAGRPVFFTRVPQPYDCRDRHRVLADNLDIPKFRQPGVR